MKYSNFLTASRRQRGGAAVELAVILPLLVVLLAVPLFLGRYFWHYSVAQKAARDAARYLSSVPVAELLAVKSPLGEVEAAKFAKSIAQIETAELNPGPGGVFIELYCNDRICLGTGPSAPLTSNGTVNPVTIRASITIQMVDIVLPGLTDWYGGVNGLTFTADVAMPYVGH
jgi:hypothetical protein